MRGADSGPCDELQSQGMLVKSVMATALPTSGRLLGLAAQLASEGAPAKERVSRYGSWHLPEFPRVVFSIAAEPKVHL